VWLLYITVGLAGLIAGGIYARRRIAAALALFGVGERAIRAVRWAIAWLLFGFPIITVASLILTLVLGRPSMMRLEGPATWLLDYPFLWALLVLVQSLPWLLAADLAHAIVRRRRGDLAASRVRAYAVAAIVGAFAVYTPVRILVEHGEVRVRHHQIGTGASGGPPFRIAFLADVQQAARPDGDHLRELYAQISASAPDLVLSGGDWIDSGPDHIAAAAATAAELRSRLGTFSVRGDHEHFAYFDRERSVAEVETAMRANGIHMISDDVRWFDHRGKRIAVLFLNHNYVHRASRDTVDALLAATASADYRIAVTHQLDTALAGWLEDRVQLVLAGHTHGGQINPVIGWTHVRLARLETPFIDGRYERGSTTILVTPGVGYSIIPLRYAAPGAIELIELSP
jgi:predicted MPP superfamily phosphohydrolase